MNPTLVKDRTHCPKGHDLRVHGYYFGANQRCRLCNRRRIKAGPSAAKDHVSEKRNMDILHAGESPVGDGLATHIAVGAILRRCCLYLQRGAIQSLPSKRLYPAGLEILQL